ncbi:glycerophosphodiester phosphodiesterase family protein [Sneathiella glossodoripedis]|uniref:glycerophosphodiester phosphodiesterase family protein n=1 Tax=Sneathiella glossodoripedis TaxID=418853 RepID=UPI0004710EAC|nr:glycerophosphodiester phosphodiesterase family protein [Sneathiella glossodoripedis]
MPFLKSPEYSKIPNWLVSTPIAHRGLHDLNAGIAENSLTSFRAAMTKGLAIELDVRFSRDEVPVVFHDEDLMRLTGAQGKLAGKLLSELNKLQLLGTKDSIPSLSEVLELVQGQVPLVIEIKSTQLPRERAVSIICKLLQHYEGDFCIQSFDPFILRGFTRKAPQILRGQLGMKSPPSSLPRLKRLMIRHMPFNWLVNPDYIGYDISDIDYLTINGKRKHKQPLLAWTVQNQSDLEKAKLYADNVIFEKLSTDLVKSR